MDTVFEFDPFSDILPEPGCDNARAGAKFQPKAKTRHRKEYKPTQSSNLPNAIITGENRDIAASIQQNSLCPTSPVVTPTNAESSTTLTNSSSKPFQIQELVQKTEVSHPGRTSFNDDGISALVDNSSGHGNTQYDFDSNQNSKVSSHLANATNTEENTDTAASILQNSLYPTSPVVTSTIAHCPTTLTNASSELFESQELEQRVEVSHPGFVSSNDGGISALVENSSRDVNTKVDIDSTQHSKLSMSDIHGDFQSGIPGLGEAADIFSELESLDGILSQSTKTNASTVRKFQPKVKINAQHREKLPLSHLVTNDAPEAFIHHASNITDLVDRNGFSAFSSNDSSAHQSCSSVPTDASPECLVSQDHRNSGEAGTFDCEGDFLMDAGRLNREEAEAFSGLQSFEVADQGDVTPGDSQSLASDTEYLEEDLTPAFPTDGFHQFSTMKPQDSAPNDLPAEFQVTEQLTNVTVASGLNATVLEEFVDPQAAPPEMSKMEGIKSRKRKSSLVTKEVVSGARSRNVEKLSQGSQDKKHGLGTGERNEAVKSTMQLRKRRTTTPAVTREDGAQENGDSPDGLTSDSLMGKDENNSDNDEYIGEESKKAPRKSKPAVKTETTVQRRKKAEEAGQLNKETPKRKFSHSTRRNRRQVNKVLLETEEAIDPKKLMIKDLILLAEAKERMSNKDKKSLPNQSVDTSFAWGSSSYDDPFSSGKDLNPDDGVTHKIDVSSIKINYHSHMEKTPKERWSKQETELFYEGIRQFGTDFAMIQQLFPGRTRHQVKLKYKKEERQQPLKLCDALTNRSKDHSHFELVIERLQHAAAVEADQNSNGDKESAGETGEEEITTETNEEVENPKQEEEGTGDLEANAPKGTTAVKSDQSDDDIDRWNQYKSDHSDFVS